MKENLAKTLLIALCIFSLTACKKDKGSDSGEDVTPIETGALNKENGLPGQVFELNPGIKLTNEEYLLTVGGTSITAVRTSDTTLTFVLPYIPSGDYFIELKSINPQLGQVPLKVNSYTPIQNVAEAKSQAIAWLAEDETTQSDVDIMMERRFNEELAELSEEEQKKQLFLIQNLIAQIEQEEADSEISLNASLKNNSSQRFPSAQQATLLAAIASTTKSRSSLSNVTEIKYHALRFTRAMIKSTILVGGGAIAFTANPLLGLGYSIFAIRALKKQINIILESVDGMYNIAAIAVNEGLDRLGLSATVKKQNLLASTTAVPTFSNGLVLLKDIPLETDITFTFGSIAPELENLVSGGLIQTLFSSYHKVIGLYSPLYAGQQKIQSLFRTSEEILPHPDKLMPQEFVKENQVVEAASLKIENISPAGLELSMSQGENGILFTASSATITDSVDISFDLVYTQEEFGTHAVKHIKASYDGRQAPHAINIVAGNNQEGDLGKKLTEKLQVKVVDKNGNTYVGANLKWAVRAGGGTLGAIVSQTNSEGVASAEWTLGNTGNQRAYVALLNSSGDSIAAVDFSATPITIIGEWIADELYQNFYPNSNGVNLIGFHNKWNDLTGLEDCPTFLRERRIDSYSIQLTANGSMVISETGYRRDYSDTGSYATCSDYQSQVQQGNYSFSIPTSYTYNSNTSSFAVSGEGSSSTGTAVLDGARLTINLPASFGKIVLRKK